MLDEDLIFKTVSDLFELAGNKTYLVIMSGHIIYCKR